MTTTQSLHELNPAMDVHTPPPLTTPTTETASIPVIIKDEEKEVSYKSREKSSPAPLIPVIVNVSSSANASTASDAVTSTSPLYTGATDTTNAISNLPPSSTISLSQFHPNSNPTASHSIPKQQQFKHLKFHGNSFETMKCQGDAEQRNLAELENFMKQISSNMEHTPPPKVSRPRARAPSIYTHIKQLPNSSSSINVQSPTGAATGPRKRGRPKGSTTKVRHKIPNTGLNLWGKPAKQSAPKQNPINHLDTAFLNLAAAQNPQLVQHAGNGMQLLNLSQQQAIQLLYQQQQQQHHLDQQRQQLFNQSALRASNEHGLSNEDKDLQNILNSLMSQGAGNPPPARQQQQQHHLPQQTATTSKQLAAMQHILNNSISLSDYTRLMSQQQQHQQQQQQPSNLLDLQLQHNIMNLEKMLQSQVLEQQQLNMHTSNTEQLDMLLKQIQSTIQHPATPPPPPKPPVPQHHQLPSLQPPSNIPILPKISSSPGLTSIAPGPLPTPIPGLSSPNMPQTILTQHSPAPAVDETKQLLEMIEKLVNSEVLPEELVGPLSGRSPQVGALSGPSTTPVPTPSLQHTQVTSSSPTIDVTTSYDKMSDLEQLISSLKSGSPIKSEPSDSLSKVKAVAKSKSFINMGLDHLLPKTRGRPPGSVSSPNLNKQSPSSADGKRHRGRPRKYPQEFYSVVNGKVRYPGARERKLFYPLDYKPGDEATMSGNEHLLQEGAMPGSLDLPRSEQGELLIAEDMPPAGDTAGDTNGDTTLHQRSPNNNTDTEHSVSPKTTSESETPGSNQQQRKKRGRPKGSKNKPCIITNPNQLVELRAQYPDSSSVWDGLPQYKQNQITAVLSGLNQKMFRQAAFQI